MRPVNMLLACAILVSSPALAQEAQTYRCSLGDMQRRVEIFHETGVAVPCEVHYYKDTEAPGERQVLWTASSQGGYCESKAAEFVKQLEGWGWSCSTGAAPSEETAPTQDDTDDLSPSEPGEDTGH